MTDQNQPFGFTEADIRAGASPQSFSRGMEYYHNGAVLEIVRRGAMITAAVEGSKYEPYEVTITLGASGNIDDANCTCPYAYGGYCKHIVAVLLEALNDSETIEEKPDLPTLLSGLNETQLRQLIATIAAENPRLITAIERAVNVLRPTAATAVATAAAQPTTPAVDADAIRRELRLTFLKETGRGDGRRRGYHYDYYDDDDYYIDTDAILKPALLAAETLLNRGAPESAAELLADVIEEWGNCIAELDEWVVEANPDAFDQASVEIDALLAESLLSLPLTADERRDWRAQIHTWTDDTIRLAISDTALEQWWDYPPLVAAMRGEISASGAWEASAPYWADELACARLRVLERQGRVEEYLNLAQAEGQSVLYLTKLVDIGEITRAVADASVYLTDPGQVLTIASLLDTRGYHAEALTVAAYGLDLTDTHGTADLARWLAQRAHARGAGDLALRAAKIAFFKSHQLADYQVAQHIAGDRWQTVRTELLEDLARSHAYSAVDIYLHERMLVEAMQEVNQSGGYSSSLTNVIEAVRTEYPDWAIEQCKTPAERIMDNGNAKYYADAVEWLRRARNIYDQHNRLAEWQAYLNNLLEIHARKHKLVPMLKQIR